MGRRLRNFRIRLPDRDGRFESDATLYNLHDNGTRGRVEDLRLHLQPKRKSGNYDSTSEDAIRVHDLLLDPLVVCQSLVGDVYRKLFVGVDGYIKWWWVVVFSCILTWLAHPHKFPGLCAP